MAFLTSSRDEIVVPRRSITRHDEKKPHAGDRRAFSA
jgi:hypothetical protein